MFAYEKKMLGNIGTYFRFHQYDKWAELFKDRLLKVFGFSFK